MSVALENVAVIAIFRHERRVDHWDAPLSGEAKWAMLEAPDHPMSQEENPASDYSKNVLYILTLLSVSSGIFAYPVEVPATLQARDGPLCSWQGACNVAACVNAQDAISTSCKMATQRCSALATPANHPCDGCSCKAIAAPKPPPNQVIKGAGGVNLANPVKKGTRT
ncbi:hypothetical protein C8J56DRAFT_1058802 [Mycena floridula]|nr:hypothetical protein C8J56DRAFT_1058802 [Mycena floridula]